MLHNNFEIRVLVKGRPINEYSHNGQIFLEGRHGSNFEIEFKNLSPTRVEAVLSVDGLSVIDGKEAGPTSSGYVVEPFGTLRVPGWKLTDEQVAAFVFAGKGKSYATQSTGSSRNNGVIGALVFAEKQRSPAYYPVHHQFSSLLVGGVQPSYTFGGTMRGMSGGGAQTLGIYNMASSTAGEWGSGHIVASAATPPSASDNIKCASSLDTTRSATSSNNTDVLQTVVQTLGTGFGQATDFETTTVQFNRGDLAAMLVLYYDDSRGLRARGIELARPSKQRIAKANAPKAFPAMNCVPPVGWKG